MLLAGIERSSRRSAIGAMIVVFMSMVGSLTVLPALLAKLGDRIDRGVARGRGCRDRCACSAARAALHRAAADAAHAAAAPEGRGSRVAHLGRRPAAVAAHPGCRRRRLGGAPRRARPAGVRHAHRSWSASTTCPATCRSCRPTTTIAEGVPGLIVAGRRSSSRRRMSAHRRCRPAIATSVSVRSLPAR